MSKTPAKRTPKKAPVTKRAQGSGPQPADSIVIATHVTAADLPLSEESRVELLAAMPEEARDFYDALVTSAYNATHALRKVRGVRYGDATFRSLARYYRHRADVDLLVRDDFTRMNMTITEARARLASIAAHSDMRLFVDEFGQVDPDAIRDFGDAVQEYSEEQILGGDEGKGAMVRRRIKLYDRTNVLEKVIKHTPVAEGGQGGADTTVNFFTQVNTQIVQK